MEIWKDISGYENIYKVSNFGNVKRNGKNENRKLSSDGKGYCVIDLWKDGLQHAYKVHRLVANAFIPNPLNKSQVNHIDGKKLNNSVDNLEWVTNLENIQHARATGLYRNQVRGSKSGSAKLNEELALQIYDLTNHKTFPLKKICEMYNMSKYAILCIKNKKSWKHIHNGG
jgi:hypothetical protein